MGDIARRLLGALPGLRAWVEELLIGSAATARPVSVLEYHRLSTYFPREVLSAAEIVLIPALPFPPVAELGVPEFESLRGSSFSGITFGHRFFVLPEHATESLCFHEIVHVIQWAYLGIDDFLLTYGVGILQYGYEDSPLESIAYSMQRAFDANEPITDVVSTINAQAARERDAARAVLRASVG